MKSRRTSLSVKEKRSGNMPVEEGDWKILQEANPPEDFLHGRAEAEFFTCINNKLGSYANLVIKRYTLQ
jgi:hypothetical protein